ncbi:hypothetical protein OVA29_16200 [Exiguobacterium sp. SL14]|nr:hypothetical protein [Exiguobacterium sp. SL14]MCY1691980.1 hypothetical protein [Exiguobacterium sp. SL14]
MTLRKRFLLSTLVTILSVVILMGWTLFQLRQIQSYNEDYGKQLVEISELETKLLYEQAHGTDWQANRLKVKRSKYKHLAKRTNKH